MRSAHPSLSVAERIDAACDRFESEWKAGRRPRIEDYLAIAPAADREQLRQALVAVDLELSGRGPAETSATRSSVRSQDKQPPVVTVEHAGGARGLPGEVGRFVIRSVLGSGAFGKVYRAFDPVLGREVALKARPGIGRQDGRRAGSIPQGGPCRGNHQPPQRLPDSRSRRARRPAVHRDGVGPRGVAGSHPQSKEGTSAREAGRADRAEDRPRTGRGPRQGDRPPRPETRQRDDRSGAEGHRGDGLRPGPRPQGCERPRHAERHRHGHAGLHVARTGARRVQGCRACRGRVQPWRHPVRTAHRREAVHRHGHRGDRPDPPR